MDSEGFNVLHLGNLRQNVHSELVEHHIIRILHKQLAVTSNIVTEVEVAWLVVAYLAN